MVARRRLDFDNVDDDINDEIDDDDVVEDEDDDEDDDENENVCVMCQQTYDGYGNNGMPLIEGNVCDVCNFQVILFRMQHLNTCARIN